MVDVVILADLKRRGQFLTCSEVMQMVGRAGRDGRGSSVFALALEDDFGEAEELLNRVRVGDVERVESGFLTMRDFGFHLLPEIVSRKVQTFEDVKNWFADTFCSFQGGELDVLEVVQWLVEMKSVSVCKNWIGPLDLGKLAVDYYLRPDDLFCWKENFEYIFEEGIGDASLSWALAQVPSSREMEVYIDEEEKNFLGESLSSNFDLDGCASVCFGWLANFGWPRPSSVKVLSYTLRKDFGRISKALAVMNQAFQWGKGEILEKLKKSISGRVPFEQSDLFFVEGMTKKIIGELVNLGICNLEEFTSAKESFDFGDFPDILKLIGEKGDA